MAFCFLLSGNREDLVILGFHGGLERGVGKLGRKSDNGGACFMADRGFRDLRQGFQGLLDAGLAVGTHHAFDFHGLFHCL